MRLAARAHGLLLRVRHGGVLGHLVLDLLESVVPPAVETGLDVLADAIELSAIGAGTLLPPRLDDELTDQVGVLFQRCKEFAHLLECRCVCLGHVPAIEVLDEVDFFPVGLPVGRVRLLLLDWGCSGGGSRCGWVAAVLRADRCSLWLCKRCVAPDATVATRTARLGAGWSTCALVCVGCAVAPRAMARAEQPPPSPANVPAGATN